MDLIFSNLILFDFSPNNSMILFFKDSFVSSSNFILSPIILFFYSFLGSIPNESYASSTKNIFVFSSIKNNYAKLTTLIISVTSGCLYNLQLLDLMSLNNYSVFFIYLSISI